ncbi:hypothetical protein AMATHDRAFT_40861 [Amanita thiersii Skay4041]|uniref:C3H1-type domain-containing protein n=1 Tax=Amanita thiersii Skay4041 TaxID=703135 RepID=A0A2A9NRU8_9AGAR|nr:hypothetical protein AMATHDRAFT_40861 [Amanita thiersii Skay4041]
MVVCQYFLRGQCKFGDNCRNEHPRQQGGGGGGGGSTGGGGSFGNLTWSNPNRGTTGGSGGDQTSFSFSVDSMTKDLTPQIDKPMWPLSSYGPAKFEPNLLQGLDESPEELRVRAKMALQAKNPNEYVTYESNKIAAAEQVYNNARSNIQQAYEQATKQSPLRSLVQSNKMPLFGNKPAFGSSGFGGATTTTTNTTSTPSAFGQPSFGQTGFGRSAPAPSAFGQPSTTTTTTSAFGQPSSTTTTGAFGQPMQQPQSTSAFGTTGFGQASQSGIIKPASGAFGSVANTTTSAFGGGGSSIGGGGGFSAFAGQPSAFGLGASAGSGNTTGGSAFGQPSAFSAFAPQQQQPPPAQQQQPAQSVFGAFGQPQAPAPSSFGSAPQQQQQPTSGFGAPPQQQPQAFNNPLEPRQPPSPFASVVQPAPQQRQPATGFSAFASVQPQQQPASGLSAFGTVMAQGHPPPNTSTFGASAWGASAAFSGSGGGSSNSNNSKKPHSGPPDFAAILEHVNPTCNPGRSPSGLYKAGATPYDQQLPPNYVEVVPKAALEAFGKKRFEWGDVPEWVPPLEMR